MERRHIKAALRICGFELSECRDFIVETEFDSWRSFTNSLTTLGGRLATAGYSITAAQTLNLSVLKFWVEDKYRMKERITSKDFQEEIIQYFPIYQTFLIAQSTSRIIPNGPKFSVNNYDEFNLGTK